MQYRREACGLLDDNDNAQEQHGMHVKRCHSNQLWRSTKTSDEVESFETTPVTATMFAIEVFCFGFAVFNVRIIISAISLAWIGKQIVGQINLPLLIM